MEELLVLLKKEKALFDHLKGHLEKLISTGIDFEKEINNLQEQLAIANEGLDRASKRMYVKNNWQEMLASLKKELIVVNIAILIIFTPFLAMAMLSYGILEFILLEALTIIGDIILNVIAYNKERKRLKKIKASEDDFDLASMQEMVLNLKKSLDQAMLAKENNKKEQLSITDKLSSQYVTLITLLEAYLYSKDSQIESKIMTIDNNIGKTIKENMTIEVLRRKKNGS